MTNKVQHKSAISRIRPRAATAGLALVAALAPGVVATSSAQAPVETVLHAFTGGTDGGYSYAGLTWDQAGNLYGMTTGGGTSPCIDNFYTGCGVVFKVGPAGHETVLHSFTGGTDGAVPFNGSGLVRDTAGNFYGVTFQGGPSHYGTVFKLDRTGKETVLYAFTGGTDGGNPYGNVALDAKGNLYGTGYAGGDLGLYGGFGAGVVFKVDPTGKETVLHAFTGGTDGEFPSAGLIRDAEGNLYGTTFGFYPSTWGTVFKLDRAGTETVLHNFTGGTDGGEPIAGLIRDAEGNLYGTASAGGDLSCVVFGTPGCGVVFTVDRTGKETVLHSFTGGADGGYPGASLIRDAVGNLYGTTLFGGIGGFEGVVFKLDRTGTETVLYSFTGGADGGNPYAPLIMDKKGNLYSTTNIGGDLNGCSGYGCGVVYKLTLN
jgi:uncharacterized repeat protein (TIGR03803 family)